MKFQSQITALRKASDLTQEELAEKLGVSRQAVSKWENGISSPEMSHISTLCEIFKVTPNTLFGFEDESEPAQQPPAPRKSWYKKLISAVCIVLTAALLVALGAAAAFSFTASSDAQSGFQLENIAVKSFDIIGGQIDGNKRIACVEFVPSVLNSEMQFFLTVTDSDGFQTEYPVEASGGVCRAEIKLDMYISQHTSLTVFALYGDNVYPEKIATVVSVNETSIAWE